ncbi:MAG: type II toxin-antitoxin system VapC family toxin [Propionibacteriaceae bacterium]|jgi:predicted nucleic acid-binding protein|nr:type II toxin-antitoxin system VapC family toxin [Propionibacteriaceae bacterium]
MSFLVDTNVVSELRKIESGQADPAVSQWARATPADELWISVISLGELELGVRRMERRDVVQGRMLREWLEDTVIPGFDGRTLPVDADVARTAAAWSVPDPAPLADSLIGATAARAGLTVATRNTAHFDRFAGLKIFDPWSATMP